MRACILILLSIINYAWTEASAETPELTKTQMAAAERLMRYVKDNAEVYAEVYAKNVQKLTTDNNLPDLCTSPEATSCTADYSTTEQTKLQQSPAINLEVEEAYRFTNLSSDEMVREAQRTCAFKFESTGDGFDSVISINTHPSSIIISDNTRSQRARAAICMTLNSFANTLSLTEM